MPRYASSSPIVGVLDGTVAPEIDWELLYDVHAPRLRRIIQRKVGPALTEDVLQETFLRAYRNRDTIDPERPLAPWLITIALRAAVDAQRRQLRTFDANGAEVVEEPWEESGFGQVEEELVRRAKHLGIKHAFASLNTRQQRVLEAVAVEGMPYESVATTEQMTPDAVKSIVARAKTNFKLSYTAFTRNSGLFGGAIGGLVLKVRARLQRYQEIVGGHATAFGAATLTVVAVGVAAYPAARPLPTSAAELTDAYRDVVSTFASSEISLPGNEAGVQATPADGADIGAGTSVAPGSGGADTVELDNRAYVGWHGSNFSSGATTTAQSPLSDTHNYFVLEVECDAGLTTAVACDVLDELPVPPR